MFRDLRIGVRLGLGFGLLVVLLVTLATVAIDLARVFRIP